MGKLALKKIYLMQTSYVFWFTFGHIHHKGATWVFNLSIFTYKIIHYKSTSLENRLDYENVVLKSVVLLSWLERGMNSTQLMRQLVVKQKRYESKWKRVVILNSKCEEFSLLPFQQVEITHVSNTAQQYEVFRGGTLLRGGGFLFRHVSIANFELQKKSNPFWECLNYYDIMGQKLHSFYESKYLK